MEKKKPKSEIKVVIYFKRRANGIEYTPEEVQKKFNRKEDYKYCYFPRKGGGYITDHEKGWNMAEQDINNAINTDNIYKGMILLCKANGDEERAANYKHGTGWDFYHRPEFYVSDKGHRYISKYQSLAIMQKRSA